LIVSANKLIARQSMLWAQNGPFLGGNFRHKRSKDGLGGLCDERPHLEKRVGEQIRVPVDSAYLVKQTRLRQFQFSWAPYIFHNSDKPSLH